MAGGALLTAILVYASLIPWLFSSPNSADGRLPSSNASFAFAAVGAIVKVAFGAFATIATWRCSANTDRAGWGIAARVATALWLAWLVVGAIALLSMRPIGGGSLLGLLHWGLVMLIAGTAVTRARGGATFASVVALALFFLSSLLLPLLAVIVRMGGVGSLLGPNWGEFMFVAGWAYIGAMFFIFPALAAATLACFAYALTEGTSRQRVARASLVFGSLLVGLLIVAARMFAERPPA